MTTPTRPMRFAGLDGLRALAVTLVVVYHLFPASIVQGGFVGVDVFFVISGFLITSLLLRPSAEPRAWRRMLDFWRRRARRLLPALAVVITVCATAAWIIGGDVLVGIGRQVLGAATFSYNWAATAAGTDYFAATAPELFRNVWSLAVEEQFYVLWPLLLPVVLLLPWRAARITVALAAAAGSAWWMAVLAGSGDVTRAYFGTDSHAFGLFLGIALAFAAERIADRPALRRRSARVLAALVGALGLALILVAALRPQTADAATFPGALLLASVGTLLAITASIVPGSPFGRVIDAAPLKWVGDRSYGIYLWHWPVLVLVTVAAGSPGPAAGVPVGAALVTLVLTVVASALSYRLVEQPLRGLGFRRSLRMLGRRLAGSPVRRLAALASVAVAVAALGGTTAAIASAPTQTSAEAHIQAGAQAVASAPPPADAPEGAAGDADAAEEEPLAGLAPSTEPEAAAAGVDGTTVTAVGDSVMLASAPALYESLPGVFVDAEVSRSVWKGPEILAALAAAGELRDHVVVALGTNGPVERGTLAEMAAAVGPARDLVLVNAFAPRDWIPAVNETLSDFADSRRNVWLADWSGAIAAHTDLLAGDDIHPGRAGGEIFAETVRSTLDRIDVERERSIRTAPDGFSPRVPFPPQ